MIPLMLTVAILTQAPEPAETPVTDSQRVESLRRVYRADAEQYEFYRDAARKERLVLAKTPAMRWATDDDWSGDVFVWTHDGRPEVIGCILSGPGNETQRLLFHEFHLLAEKPIASTQLLTPHTWEPKVGVALQPVKDAPPPAKTAAARLTQMRQLSREFTAHMEANGEWELRLLPQPLIRYGDDTSDVIDGSLFAWVWPKGTDPELILLLECRKTAEGPAWHFSPVRFSNRPLWLKLSGEEVWRVDTHREPKGPNDLVYTTDFARNIPREPPVEAEKKKAE